MPLGSKIQDGMVEFSPKDVKTPLEKFSLVKVPHLLVTTILKVTKKFQVKLLVHENNKFHQLLNKKVSNFGSWAKRHIKSYIFQSFYISNIKVSIMFELTSISLVIDKKYDYR